MIHSTTLSIGQTYCLQNILANSSEHAFSSRAYRKGLGRVPSHLLHQNGRPLLFTEHFNDRWVETCPMAPHPGKMACFWPLSRGPGGFCWAPRKTNAKSPSEWTVYGICQVWELCCELEHGSLTESCTQWLSSGAGYPWGMESMLMSRKSHLSSCTTYPDALSVLSEPLGTEGQQSFHCANKAPKYSRR